MYRMFNLVGELLYKKFFDFTSELVNDQEMQ